MPRYPNGDPSEREPLEGPHEYIDSSRRDAANAYEDNYSSNSEPPYYDMTSLGHPQQSYVSDTMLPQQQPKKYQPYQPFVKRDSSSSSSYGDDNGIVAPPPPPPHRSELSRIDGSQQRAEHLAQNNNPPEGHYNEHAAGGMYDGSYEVHNARESDVEALGGSTGQLPPPPSRAQYPSSSLPGVGYASDNRMNRVSGQQQLPEPGSRSTLNPFGTPSATHSPARSIKSFGTESYADDPYQGRTISHRYHDASLGVVNPHEIIDDGDDGLHYGKHSQRTSILSLSQSDRARGVVGPAAAAGGAAGIGAAAAAMGGAPVGSGKLIIDNSQQSSVGYG